MQKAPCSKCGGNLEFDAELIGTTAVCPHCGEEILLTGPKSSGKGTLALGIVIAVLTVGVVAIAIARHGRQERSNTRKKPALPAASQSPSQENPPSSGMAASNAEQRLLQPINGVFGYTLGEKLPKGLRIGPAQTFRSNTTNYMPIEDITVRCLSDRRICAITGFTGGFEDDNYVVVEQDLVKKYGQGSSTKDNAGKICAIKWSDGKCELELSRFMGTVISCHNTALEKTANQQLESAIEEAIPRLFQPATGTLGWRLGEKLPDDLSIDTAVQMYFDRTTNYWPFQLSAHCLSDRRIWMIESFSITDMGGWLSTSSHSNLIEDYLEGL